MDLERSKYNDFNEHYISYINFFKPKIVCCLFGNIFKSLYFQTYFNLKP